MAINTLFQLHAHVHSGAWPRNAVRLLTMPDLFHHVLCGSDVGEYTHATTTQMVRHDTKDWDRELCRRVGIPASILPKLVPPGTRLGKLRGEVTRATGLDCEVVAPASHDTASAVAATPLSDRTAYVSSGTWSLVGVELPAPLVNDETLKENCTNEGGVDGTTRFLKNVTGLWILEGCRRSWEQGGRPLSWEELDAAIARAPAWTGVIAPDDPAFFNPPDMAAAVRDFLVRTGQPAPEEPGVLARIVLESLALRCAEVLGTIARLADRRLRAVRVIGGGSRNDFLNQALADVTDLEILAGPAEATAIGNLLVQAVAAGRFRDLAAGRAYVAQMLPAKRFYSRGDPEVEPAVERLRRQLGGTKSFR
jgi:rhamnulokinase